MTDFLAKYTLKDQRDQLLMDEAYENQWAETMDAMDRMMEIQAEFIKELETGQPSVEAWGAKLNQLLEEFDECEKSQYSEGMDRLDQAIYLVDEIVKDLAAI